MNPAVSFGLLLAGRFDKSEFVPYVIVQVVAAIAAAATLSFIAGGQPGFDLQASGLAANGYGDHSPGGYTLLSGLVIEIIMTFMFLFIILGATDERAPKGLAPVAIGLGLTLVHLIRPVRYRSSPSVLTLSFR